VAGQGLQARFALFPGVGHSVTPEMEQEIARFFTQCLEAEFGPPRPTK